MTAPLDEKALAEARTSFEMENSLERAIRAYLAASPSPSMEMEVVEGLLNDGQPLVTLSNAQSALAAMRAERDEAKENASALRGLLEYSEDSIARLQSKWQFQLERADAAEAAEARIKALEEALNWALGCGDDFRPREGGEGAFWWRKELVERAGMTYDREAGMYRLALKENAL